MRAQHFYTTAINTLEDAAGRIFPVRDKAETEGNQTALQHRPLWVSDKRN
jgi:hypothetical protein